MACNFRVKNERDFVIYLAKTKAPFLGMQKAGFFMTQLISAFRIFGNLMRAC